MTEQPKDTTAPEGKPMADEPIPDAGASAKAREWLAQLEAMIQGLATQAAPVARQVGAKAAELAAIAATKAGPIAQKAATVTADVGQRVAERASSVAADLRAQAPAADDAPTADDDTIAEPTLGDEPAEGPRT